MCFLSKICNLIVINIISSSIFIVIIIVIIMLLLLLLPLQICHYYLFHDCTLLFTHLFIFMFVWYPGTDKRREKKQENKKKREKKK